MTNRRLPHTPATSAHTGGDDRPAGACYGLAERMAPEPTPFDVLTDLTAGIAYRAALHEARELCGSCPIMAACLRANRDETWAQAIIGKESSEAQIAYQKRRANKRAEANAARLADLRALIADGADVAEACRRLSLSRDALWTWCKRNAPAEFAALNAESPYGNQYRQVAPLSRRRKSRAKTEVAA